jgi:hypothetical protein
LDWLGFVDLTLVESEDVEQCDVVHVDSNTDLWWCRWIRVPGQERKKDGVGTVIQLLCRVCMDIASKHVPNIRISNFTFG